jgi:ubiquinol-cytochrome c reductase iron-sulfur subunit
MTEFSDPPHPGRRATIVQAAVAFQAVGCSAALWPFIAQMNPHPGTPAPATREIDLRAIDPGESKTVAWRGLPIAIRHRTSAEVHLSRSVPVSELPDRHARNDALGRNATASDANRTQAGHEEWLVVISICTHLGCRLQSTVAAGMSASSDGWVCPCHAARFDLSGRVRSGPARTNLTVPRYEFVTPTKIRIG